MTTRILVAGIGNIFLGDDGFGSEVVRNAELPQDDPTVQVIDYGIRGMHLAYDLLEEWDTLVDWWDPLADNAVRPEIDAVLVNGVRIARGSKVRLRPRRHADAQDIFVAGKAARVTSVHEDVEGNTHVGVVVDDDPAADLHDWYGRYLYFSPDEIEPLHSQHSTNP